MCGFHAELRFDGAMIDVERLKRATAVLRPRGPDAEGLWISGSMGLGHCRLRVIDTTDASSQPLVSEGGETVCAFNGCIYNFIALRAELKTLGMRFRTSGDTEVVLRA